VIQSDLLCEICNRASASHCEGERGHSQAEAAAAGYFTTSRRVTTPPGEAVLAGSVLMQYLE